MSETGKDQLSASRVEWIRSAFHGLEKAIFCLNGPIMFPLFCITLSTALRKIVCRILYLSVNRLNPAFPDDCREQSLQHTEALVHFQTVQG